MLHLETPNQLFSVEVSSHQSARADYFSCREIFLRITGLRMVDWDCFPALEGQEIFRSNG